MQHITLEEVKAACRKAYDEGTLLMVAPSLPMGENEYGYRLQGTSGEVRCAIGAALTAETLDLIDQHNLHEETIPSEKLQSAFTWDKEEEEELGSIQWLHDFLVDHTEELSEDKRRFYEKKGFRAKTRSDLVKKFLALIS